MLCRPSEAACGFFYATNTNKKIVRSASAFKRLKGAIYVSAQGQPALQ
jgi:hypothetical protein